MVPTTRSYSPGKAETAALLDYEVTEPTLPDTVSRTQHYSPHPRVIFFYSPPPSPPLSLPPCLLPPFLLSILPLFPLLALLQQIKGYTNPQQFLPAHEDFGSFRASQTTFADTKVQNLSSSTLTHFYNILQSHKLTILTFISIESTSHVQHNT